MTTHTDIVSACGVCIEDLKSDASIIPAVGGGGEHFMSDGCVVYARTGVS